VNEDTRFVCPDDESLAQRYVLAMLYFATSGDAWTEGSFLTGDSECEWKGVECLDDGWVSEIKLGASNLQGSIPDEIGSLTFLKYLDLSDNSLNDTIPSTLGKLSHLEYLDLDKNELSGKIPVELYQAISLRVIDLDSNKLSGRISSRIEQLTDLYFIQVDFNQLQGEVPEELGNLPQIQYVSLLGNNFTAPLSQSFCGKDITLHANCDMCAIDDCCTACLAVSS